MKLFRHNSYYNKNLLTNAHKNWQKSELSLLRMKEAWRRGCDAGSHTRGCEFEPHAGHSYAFRFISAAFRAVSRALMVLNYSHWVMLGSGTGVGN